MNNLNQEKLALVGMAREFVGKNYGVATSILFVTAPPGGKVRLHLHDYDEIIVVQEGRAMCTVGTEQREVHAGDVIPIPAGTPHGFMNIGEIPLRQIDIHAHPEFITRWLEEE
jgi:mannose-6-phosphate isomerase-like protein (cupin superfamily)